MDSGYVLSPVEDGGVNVFGQPVADPVLLTSFSFEGGARQQDESDGGFVAAPELLTSPALVMCYVEAEAATWDAIEADGRFVVLYREPIVEVV